MLPHRCVGEIASLLESHGLQDDAAALKDGACDPDAVLRVLLAAYQETQDDAFFDCFYARTYRLFVGRAKSRLEAEGVEADPEEIAAEVYGVLLQGDRDSHSEETRAVILTGYDIVDRRVACLAKGREQGEDSARADARVPGPADLRPEEERRALLLRAHIHGLMEGGLLDLAEQEVEILQGHYSDLHTIQEIAARKGIAYKEVCDLLCRTRRKIQDALSAFFRPRDPGEGKP